MKQSMRRWQERIKRVFGNGLVLMLAGILAAGLALVAGVTGGLAYVWQYCNLWLLGGLTAVFVFVMCTAGIWKDFINGFRLVFFQRKNATRIEMQKAVNALEAARRLTALEGVLTVAVYLVKLLYHMNKPLPMLGPLLSLIFLSVIYTGIFALVVIPVGVKLKNLTISFMEETEEDTQKAEEDGQAAYFRFRSMGLTDREAEVARLVCLGLTNKEIGEMLYISDTTVKKHMTHILEKLSCTGREELTELIKGESAVKISERSE